LPGQIRIFNVAAKTRVKIEKDIAKEVAKYFKALSARVLAGLEKSVKGIDLNDLLNFDAEVEEARKSAKRFFTSGVAIGIATSNDLLKTNIDSSFKNEKVRLVVEALSKRYADDVIETQREALRTIVTNAVDSGQGVSDVKFAIHKQLDAYAGASQWKAQRIARTEASYSYDQASLLSYKELGVTSYDVIGCEDDTIVDGQAWGCNSVNIPESEIDSVVFHPNHTGAIVPSAVFLRN
jgi:hypothetical protein